jgi:hypothetical protein
MKKTPAQLDAEIAERLSIKKINDRLAAYGATPHGSAEDEAGTFYLTDSKERPLGVELQTRPAAKRAAMKLVREGTHPRVEVWHRWRGGRYMQGQASEDGWSDV